MCARLFRRRLGLNVGGMSVRFRPMLGLRCRPSGGETHKQFMVLLLLFLGIIEYMMIVECECVGISFGFGLGLGLGLGL